ncbi:MAG: radical SAM protein [Candidatus Omnitrophica bacterium]|nr:radical SAM protein [Candidatus Omnitrophota bacterium]
MFSLKNNLHYLSNSHNMLRLLGILSRSRAFTGPLKITLDITNKCDMACEMCWYHSGAISKKKPDQHISCDTFSALVKQLKTLQVNTILFTGEGEPLMHPDLFKLISIAGEQKINVELMTNAFYLDKTNIAKLIEKGVKKILVSLHCADAETFQRIRPSRNKKDFNTLLNNLFLIKSLKGKKRYPLLFLVNVISNLNYHNAAEMIALSQKLSADKLLFKPLLMTPELNKRLIPPESEQEEFVEKISSISSKIKIPNNIKSFLNFASGNKIPQKIQSQTKQKPCYLSWVQSVITLEGEVLGCVYAEKKSLGNINKLSFKDIWYGEKYRTFRKGKSCPEECPGKTIYPLFL